MAEQVSNAYSQRGFDALGLPEERGHLVFFFFLFTKNLLPWRDSISRPIAPVSLAAGGDVSTRPRRGIFFAARGSVISELSFALSLTLCFSD
jgi:hypothetical protein